MRYVKPGVGKVTDDDRKLFPSIRLARSLWGMSRSIDLAGQSGVTVLCKRVLPAASLGLAMEKIASLAPTVVGKREAMLR